MELDGAIEPFRNKNIILIGMRGSGKTTIGKLLQERTGKEFVDSDDEVVERLGMSIPEAIKKYGHEYFRDKESEILQELSERSDIILATGGGAVVRPKNAAMLRKNSVCIWLQASIADLVSRTANDPNRMPLTDKATPEEEVREVHRQRFPLYESLAHETINTEGKTEQEVVEEILLKLKMNK